MPALSAEFIAAAEAAGGQTAYKRIGVAAGKFAENPRIVFLILALTFCKIKKPHTGRAMFLSSNHIVPPIQRHYL